jgi:APA family basic amino acid/polyamine antiporter
VLGLIGCAVLAFSLPIWSVISGAGVLLLGAVVWFLRRPTASSLSRS